MLAGAYGSSSFNSSGESISSGAKRFSNLDTFAQDNRRIFTCFIFVSGLTGIDIESPLLEASEESELGVLLLH